MARNGNTIGYFQKRDGTVCRSVRCKVERVRLTNKCFYNMHIMSDDIIYNGMTWFHADFHLHTKSEKAFQK